MDRDERGAQLKTAPQLTVDQAITRYLDHLMVERGLARHTLQAYRRDLRRYSAALAVAVYAGFFGAVASQATNCSSRFWAMQSSVSVPPNMTGRPCSL